MKEEGIMFCPKCEEVIDIPNSFKEYFIKQGRKEERERINKIIDEFKGFIVRKWEKGKYNHLISKQELKQGINKEKK